MASAAGAFRATRQWRQQRANRRSVQRFGEFWHALQQVGDALAEAQKAAKRADDTTWKARNQRHWNIATVDEVRTALRGCKSSLRICSSQAKRFEPQIIVKDWRR